MTAQDLGYPIVGFAQGSGAIWLFASVALLLSTTPIVPFIFLSKGRVFSAALEETVGLGRPTPQPIVAFADPLTRAAHPREIGAAVTILTLMFAKPF